MATQKLNPQEVALEEERKLFEREMAGVRPLTLGGPEVIFERHPDSRKPQPREGGHRPSTQMTIEEKNGQIWGHADGVSQATMRKLAKGEFPVSATCNLHGYRKETARHRVSHFLMESQQGGRHVVLIVCGRGLHSGQLPPVLRSVALDVLGKAIRDGLVLAVVQAPPRLGGEGAWLVMLRKKPMR